MGMTMPSRVIFHCAWPGTFVRIGPLARGKTEEAPGSRLAFALIRKCLPLHIIGVKLLLAAHEKPGVGDAEQFVDLCSGGQEIMRVAISASLCRVSRHVANDDRLTRQGTLR